MLTLTFWRAAGERAVKTFAQTLAALLVADGTGLVGTAWGDRLSVAGMALVVSLLTSVGTGAVTDGNPSAVQDEKLAVEPAVVESRADLSKLDRMDGVGRHAEPIGERSKDFDDTH